MNEDDKLDLILKKLEEMREDLQILRIGRLKKKNGKSQNYQV